MECVRGVGETRGPVTAGLGFVDMRVEHDLCAAPGGPADRFRIAPAFMANDNTKCQRAGLKNAPPGAGRIGTLLAGVELDFVLEAGDGSISIDDQSRDYERIIHDAFGAEYNREICLRGGRGDGGPRAFEEYRIGGRHQPSEASVAWNEALRKADEAGALDGGLKNGLFSQRDGILGSRREWEVGERDSKGGHAQHNSTPRGWVHAVVKGYRFMDVARLYEEHR